MAETDLTNMTSEELVEALIEDNSLASEFDRLSLWNEFNSSHWLDLLSAQPQFIEKAKEYSSGWVAILQSKQELAKQCDKWNEFNSYEWSKLLTAQPQFADKCDRWNEFPSHHWSDLLSAQPQFIEKAKEFASGWNAILLSNPELADQCDKWNEFEFWEWYDLLSYQPQFADKCPNKKYDKFTQEQWEELEAKHPGVFKEKHMSSTLRKLAKD